MVQQDERFAALPCGEDATRRNASAAEARALLFRTATRRPQQHTFLPTRTSTDLRMCGIAGYLLERPTPLNAGLVETLLDGIRHRGPDDEGVCLLARADGRAVYARTDRTRSTALQHLHELDAAAAYDAALINTRFAIIDPGPAGHQPFASTDGSIIAVFNGEIYNHVELREHLESSGSTFRTACDTEVIVEGYRAWGDALWNRLNGFWAVALYDSRDGTVTLCRDRLGVAPFYLRELDHGIAFASAIEPLRQLEPLTIEIDHDRVRGFIETSLKDFDDATLFSEITSLPPATVVRFAAGVARRAATREHIFWRPPDRRLTPRDLPFEEAVRAVRETLFSAVELRLRADVPVAFELSGGLDSSSIVVAAAIMRRDIVSYTIDVPGSNEEPYARSILDRYAVDYRVLRNPEHDFLDHADCFARRMEEPFHSPNIYTHYKMRQRMKADGIDVVLSGSGGDEVLAGYEPLFWRQAGRAMREDGQRLPLLGHALAMHARHLRSAPLWHSRLSRARHRLRGLLHRGSDPPAPLAPAGVATALAAAYPSLSWQEQRLYHFRTGLLPYYLRSNDQFTMAIPLEHRFPFLDYRMVELGLRMPPSYLFRRGWTKYVLRAAMQPYLPKRILWRRDKVGFPFPLEQFLRENRDRLAPHFERVRAADLLAGTTTFDALLAADADRLWRACSAGIWMRTVHGSAR
jgi:asparagine synthase (glutamine-hydrolysing)